MLFEFIFLYAKQTVLMHGIKVFLAHLHGKQWMAKNGIIFNRQIVMCGEYVFVHFMDADFI